MLQKITLLNSDDIGLLAELSLFYKTINFDFNERLYDSISKKIDPKVFIQFLLDSGSAFQAEYHETNFIVGGAFDDSVTIRVGGYEQVGDRDFLYSYCYKEKVFGKNTNKFIDSVINRNVDRKYLDLIYEDIITDKMLPYLSQYLNIEKGRLKEELKIKYEYGCIYIDVPNEQRNYRRLFWAIDTYVRDFETSIKCSEINSDYISEHKDDKLTYSLAALQNTHLLNEFKEFVLRDIPSIKSVINNGNCSFEDYLKLYKKSEKFREWLYENSSDEDLVSKYFCETVKQQWHEKLPNKTLRWSLFTGAGVTLDSLGLGGLGTLAEVTLGVFDTFILDKIITGWKPNVFIDDLKRFTTENNR